MRQKQLLKGNMLGVGTATVVVLILSACAPHASRASDELVGEKCDKTICDKLSEDRWKNHIKPNHCSPPASCDPNKPSSKSIFFTSTNVCASPEGARAFCKKILDSKSCKGEVKDDKVVYRAQLNEGVGNDTTMDCEYSGVGTVVYNKKGAFVETMYPGEPQKAEPEK